MHTKFSELPYTRPDGERFCSSLANLAKRMDAAETMEEARSIIQESQKLEAEMDTLQNIASIRHTIDTRDAFYEKEQEYFDHLSPLLEEKRNEFHHALLHSPLRRELEKEYGEIWFKNMEMAEKTFSPAIIPLMQEENSLCSKYQKLYASAQIPFEGKICTIAQLVPFKMSPDRDIRRKAFEAEGRFFDEHKDEFDSIFDALVKNRTAQAKKLGYRDFVELGYLRRQRNCYGPEGVANFRRQVVEEIVPIASAIKEAQARRIGVSDFKFWDDLFCFPDGNAAPEGSKDEIMEAGRKMYTEMSPETAEFINLMMDADLFDVEAKEGKAPGGYCTFLEEYAYPFIFSNFNGTSADVDVLTHEAGHAFAFYTSAKEGVYPLSLRLPTMDGAETHSMSMEFLTAPWHSLFFGKSTDKYELAHAEDALTFIPYGCMVDHFQEIVYRRPEMTPEERNAEWAKLNTVYYPYADYADLPFYSRGASWQWKMHIYLNPFYYVDYCIAQTIAFQFWTKSLENWDEAWKTYVEFAKKGGKYSFVELVKSAGLLSPLEDGSLKTICSKVKEWLQQHQMES